MRIVQNMFTFTSLGVMIHRVIMMHIVRERMEVRVF